METKRKTDFGLDSALRYLYYALRNGRCPLVAIEFEHHGNKYRADTPKEAAELRSYLERQDAVQGQFGTRPKIWSADLAMELLNGIGEAQRKLLEILSGGASVESKFLVKGIGLDSQIALAGVVSGLSKQLKKMSIEPHDVYRVEIEWKGKSKDRHFRLLPDFQEALMELGFPEAWEKNKT
jgi:hypothetical protein